MSKNYTIQRSPLIIPAPDNKSIIEVFGQATTGDSNLSLAHMVAPPGWSEPCQTPEFDEYVYILKGKKQFNVAGEIIVVSKGEAIKIHKNVRVQYSNPFNESCEYIAICTPAFDLNTVHREDL